MSANALFLFHRTFSVHNLSWITSCRMEFLTNLYRCAVWGEEKKNFFDCQKWFSIHVAISSEVFPQTPSRAVISCFNFRAQPPFMFRSLHVAIFVRHVKNTFGRLSLKGKWSLWATRVRKTKTKMYFVISNHKIHFESSYGECSEKSKFD